MLPHRISNLVYDDRQRGFKRFLREFLGAVVCPIKELNRFISGYAWMVADYYCIFTWKGYEGKDLEHTDPLYLNAQGHTKTL